MFKILSRNQKLPNNLVMVDFGESNTDSLDALIKRNSVMPMAETDERIFKPGFEPPDKISKKLAA